MPTDTQILDWLERQGNQHYSWEVQTPEDYPNVNGCVWLRKNTPSIDQNPIAARDAIAAAMAREAGE